MQKRILGPEHPNTLTSMNSLGKTYYEQGKLSEEEEVKAMDVQSRTVGAEHPRTLG